MPKILIVHGISNQYFGEMELRAAWHPAVCDGLLRVGYSPLPELRDCFCPFYGDLFRPKDRLSIARVPTEEDLDEASEDEKALLEQIWVSAATMEAAVPDPKSYGDTLFRAPNIAQRALNALAKSKYLAEYLPLQFFGDLKQVVLYLGDAAVRRQVIDRVLAHIEAETRIVIGEA